MVAKIDAVAAGLNDPVAIVVLLVADPVELLVIVCVDGSESNSATTAEIY
jgi:hypothetical protein